MLALLFLLATSPAVHEDDLFRQLAAHQYDAAVQTLSELPPSVVNVRWQIYAKSKATAKPFADVFRETMRTIDDNTAHRVLWTFGTSPVALRNALKNAKPGTPDYVRRAVAVEAYDSFAAEIPALAAEDDARRYVIQKDLAVRMRDGGTVCALIIRPRTTTRLPAIFNFTIYADPDNNYNEARRAASNGYAGIVGLTRGKGCSPDAPQPYERDGADAAAVIDWIAAQPWSDGRVGMYGGSYEGFTTWAAAKHHPRALKAIMDGAPVAPGVDVPMENSVFWSFVYPWPFYTTNNKTLDNDTYNQGARWAKLNHDWYVSGRAYRDLDKIDGTPNPIFRTWLAHPSYDAYWQSMIPVGDEFAKVDIPVLTTAGYYYGGPGAAMYYFSEHRKHRPNAEHYLLVGPWDHVRGHSGTINVVGAKTMTNLAGYEIEPNAHVDIVEMRYQWFNYVFKRGAKPALLSDNVNTFVVGANQWAHAPSIAAMARARRRIKLDARELTVDFADRSDVDREVPGGNVVDKAIDTANGAKFVDAPLEQPLTMSGLFSCHLAFTTNKKDFDFEADLYELTAAGEYVLLSNYWQRASYNGHRERRVLLEPGTPQTLDFTSNRIMTKALGRGSRLVVVLSVVKDPGRQMNYGTGKDVSDETIADAKEPLRITLLPESWIEVPVR
ncbi:MAG TPA: CocE/NonD family hydrolase [Thermoanaerobaculia bacterium]|nr:CocE/NonD family hydrolase [Thermoanaerobaculia bacterium]